jgi:uncharacterized iron-regulated protein
MAALNASACVPLGAWSVPGAAGVQPIGAREVLLAVQPKPVVLLGESHATAEHHRWQLHTLAALHGQRPDLVVAFEMFPRRVQDVLDRWVAGKLSESEFLQRSDWAEVWGFDAAYYLPLFHFARMHRVPMVALNVDRDLVRRIGREGPEAVPDSQREGVGHPEPANAAYLRELHAVYVQHGEGKAGALDDPAFRRFVAGQLMWDRAMAEGIRHARSLYPGRQVVAVMGRGHTGPGAVPYQLRALGIADTAVLLPWDSVPECTPPERGSADAVFGVAASDEAVARSRPRLGVTLAAAIGPGARVERIEPGSIAEQAGLRAGDVLLTLAGREVLRNADVLSAIARQAPGTWLPIRVRRDGSELELVAKFPPR